MSNYQKCNKVATDAKNLITSFMRLGKGWHFGEGLPATQEAAGRAMKIVCFAARHGWEIEAFPGISGDITLSCYQGELEIEITILSDESYSYNVIENNIYVNKTRDAELSEIINKLLPNGSCNISDFYTRVIGAEKSLSFPARRFATSPSRAYPLSRLSAQNPVELEQSASTSNNTIPNRPNQSCYGVLIGNPSPFHMGLSNKQVNRETSVTTILPDSKTNYQRISSNQILQKIDGQTIEYAIIRLVKS